MNNSGNSQPDSPEAWITAIVYPMVGRRCKTLDKHDFPDMIDDDNRCLVCATYEKVDEALAKLDQYYTNKVLEVVNHGTPDYSKLDVRNEAMLEGYNLAVTELRQAIKQLNKRGE